MESSFYVKATVSEMNGFFERDGGVRYMEIKDDRYTEAQLNLMPEEQHLQTVFRFPVVYRHRELPRKLHGTYTLAGLKKRIKAMNAPYEDGKGAGDSKEEHI